MNEKLNQQLNTVTPLSKYLALALFIVLPFGGLYIGYVYAPEKVVEIERIVEVEVAVQEQYEGTQLPWQREIVISDIQSKYVQETLTLLSLSETDEYFSQPEVLDYFVHVRQLTQDKTLVSYCYGCSHVPSGYFIFDEQTGMLERELDQFAVPFAQMKWVQMRVVDTSEVVTVLVAVEDKTVVAYDYANDTSFTLYTESAADITLCEFSSGVCVADFFVTGRGQVVFGRYQSLSGAIDSESFIEAVVVTLPPNYQYIFET